MGDIPISKYVISLNANLTKFREGVKRNYRKMAYFSEIYDSQYRAVNTAK